MSTPATLSAAQPRQDAFSALPDGEPLPMRQSADIATSRIGVGFETLDRYMFDPARVYPHLAELGAKWARVQTGWSRCEVERGRYDFAWLDSVVDELLAVGVQPWFNLTYGNQLHMPDAPHRSAVGSVPTLYGEDTLAAWKRFVVALGTHFADRVKQWEIWNEPNCHGFWRPGAPDPAQYVQLIRETAPEIRQAVPSAFLIGGATLKVEPALLEDYLEMGLADLVDAYSFHPYRLIAESGYAQEVQAMRAILRRRGAAIELWQGECGCPAQVDDHHDTWIGVHTVDESIHARFVLRRLMCDLAQDLDRVQYFHAVDLMASDYVLSDGKKDRPVRMGLIRGEDYQPRLAFHAMRAVCSLLDGDANVDPSPVGVGLPAGSDGSGTPIGHIAAQTACFRRNDYPLLAYWRPDDPQRRTPCEQATVWFVNCRLRDIQRPVLIDPLSQRIFDISDRLKCVGYHRYTFSPLPYVDYPLFVTDRDAIQG